MDSNLKNVRRERDVIKLGLEILKKEVATRKQQWWAKLSFLVPTIISLFAIMVACLSLYVSHRLQGVAEAANRYSFWQNIHKSKLDGIEAESRLSALLATQPLGELMNPIFGKNGAISCSKIEKHQKTASQLGRSILSLALEIDADYRNAAMGNHYLGYTLNIAGWDRFMKARPEVDHYWTNVALSGMHLGLFYAHNSYKCLDAKEKQGAAIPINSLEENLNLQVDLNRLVDLMVALSLNETPSTKAYESLEVANTP